MSEEYYSTDEEYGIRHSPLPKVEATISDDRTRAGTFERTGQQWVALKPFDEQSAIQMRERTYSSMEPPTQQLNLRDLRERVRRSRAPRQQADARPGRPALVRASSATRQRPPKYDPLDISDLPDFRAVKNVNGDRADDWAGTETSQAKSDDALKWQEVFLQQNIGNMAKLLGIPTRAAASLDDMRTYISGVQKVDNTSATKVKLELRSQDIHCVLDNRPSDFDFAYLNQRGGKTHGSEKCRLYLDKPYWRSGANKQREILKGDIPVDSIQRYLATHPEVSFIVLKQYSIAEQQPIDEWTSHATTQVDSFAEFIMPASRILMTAMADFLERIGQKRSKENNGRVEVHRQPMSRHSGDRSSSSSDAEDDIAVIYKSGSKDTLQDLIHQIWAAPYYAIYHARGVILDSFTRQLDENESTHFQLMLGYIFSNLEHEYTIVDKLVNKGKICNAYMGYLFQPGMIIVSGEGSDARGYMSTSGLTMTHDSDSDNSSITGNCYINAWYWKFDHYFRKDKSECIWLNITISSYDYVERSIDSLMVRPLAFASEQTVTMLRDRGQRFWKCRIRHMVSYTSVLGQRTHYASDTRYMIDMVTYNELHQESRVRSRNQRLRWMDNEEPPDEDFVYLSPLTIQGFNLKSKKWEDLNIDGMSDVTWNTSAFDSLVINGKTKKLIQALISNQIEADMSTDIISGKGNGLIMLLHGSPGTGKTLTAEGVAEIAQRPLYPVTCGDIGTDPTKVEKYLESVLHLGRTWGCVVLLDEADVFLEQRSLEDLHRNALVSVFLRMLEYYDGILVLTSNRVGTFDEAFKSRIQLAIHYPSLSMHQRTRIWENFFKRLEQLNEEGIDFDDLKDHVDKLAEHKMNGREIRNVITTARQFARWERKQAGGERYMLNYKVLEEVIETSGKFDKYIATLHGGFSQDQLAEDEGLRLANGVE